MTRSSRKSARRSLRSAKRSIGKQRERRRSAKRVSRFASDATYIPIAELALDLGFSEYSLRKWARNDLLTGVEKWGRHYRFRRGEVRRIEPVHTPAVGAAEALAQLEKWEPSVH